MAAAASTASAAWFRDRRATDRGAAFDRVARLAWLLDSAVRIPGTGIRIGADAALGLIPGLGNAASTVLSAWLIREAWRMGVPMPTLLRMVGNVALDTTASAIPVVGNVVDVFWRANRRNVAILARHLERERSRPGAPPTIDGEWRPL